MFDYATGQRQKMRTGASRLWTSIFSAVAHVAVLVVLAVPALYATDTLPEPHDVLAYVVTVPPPPPPPPPPAPKAERPKPTPDPKPRPVREPRPVPVKEVAPAPVEAPSTITEETDAEGMPTADITSMAGFESGVEGGVPGGVPGGVVGGIESGLLPPPPPATPVRVGGRITPPRQTHRVNPVYPAAAEAARIEGVVILEATVDETGRVADLRPLRSHPLLEQPAIEAVRQWRYDPLVLNGIPTPFLLTVTVSFTLDR